MIKPTTMQMFDLLMTNRQRLKRLFDADWLDKTKPNFQSSLTGRMMGKRVKWG